MSATVTGTLGDAFGYLAFGVSPFAALRRSSFDYLAAVYADAPGVVIQRELVDAIWQAFAINGYQPLTAAQVQAIAGTVPYPTSLPRMEPL